MLDQYLPENMTWNFLEILNKGSISFKNKKRESYLSALRAEPATVPFLREPCSWAFLFFMFFQASLSRNAANNSFKTIILAVDFMDFVMSNPTKTSLNAIQNRLKVGYGAVMGALGGDLGTMLVPGWSKAQKWNQKSAIPWSGFGAKIKTRNSCSGCLFSIFVGLGCPKPRFRLPFWLHFETSGPWRKQLKVL